MNKFVKKIVGFLILLIMLIKFSLLDYTSLNIPFANNSNNNNSYEVSQSINELISQIEIEEANENYYDRDEWTSYSQNYEYNGQEFDSIRSYAFYASKHYDEESGEYVDPYTNKVEELKNMDYDHIIPLHYANQHGADEWSDEKKKEYADDPTVGIVVNARDNRAKGDKGPCEWLPEENVEDYCFTWLVLAAKWDLSMDQECMDTIKEQLNGVPESELQIINQYN